MVKVNVNMLEGKALDYAVSLCEGWDSTQFISGMKNGEFGLGFFEPSTNWSQGGPIIERERLHLCPVLINDKKAYQSWPDHGISDEVVGEGETPLIAAMRCYVASHLGDVVDIPDELV